jgi:UDP-N-acetylmuramate--alanine ligase
MIDEYHFIGIGGIGMSALARLLLEKGKRVNGSDLSTNQMVKKLKNDGANINQGHDEVFLEKMSKVIYSSAVRDDNPEIVKAKKLKCPLLHRSDLLADLMRDSLPLMVAGAHGKTSTSSLLSSVLMHAKLDPTFMVGGIVNQYQTNARYGKGIHFVAEVDESDGSIMKAFGFGCIVTNVDKEHLDYWKSFENIKIGFTKFLKENVKSKKHLFWCIDDVTLREINPDGISYGFSKDADLRISSWKQDGFFIDFDIEYENKQYTNIVIPMIGEHNCLNAASVFGMAIKLGIDEKVIKEAFLNFQGTKRRMQKIAEKNTVTFFDDYAHHPTEINSMLKSLRQAVTERRIIAIFQPHRYSRTKDMLNEYRDCFDSCDELIVTDIYSAHEKKIEGISTKILIDEIKKKRDVKYVPRDEIESYLLQEIKPFDVAVSVGAGDITNLFKLMIPNFSTRKKKLSIALIFGGKSLERDISIRSAKNVYNCLDRDIFDTKLFHINKNGHWQIVDNFEQDLSKDANQLISKDILLQLQRMDLCLPIFHGPNGEDGTIHGFLQTLNLDFVGSDVFSSSLCMDKAASKKLCKSIGLNIADFIEISLFEWKNKKDQILKKITSKFDLSKSVYIKPNRYGSSIGISNVDNMDLLIDALEKAFKYDQHILVEEKIIAREIEIAIIGDDYIEISNVGEILRDNKFYDYEKKYGNSPTKKSISANVSKKEKENLKQIARQVYVLSKCSSMARVDLFLCDDGEIYFNEINTIPGCSENSLFVRTWEGTKIKNATDLLNKIIISALYRKRKINSLV